MRWDWTLTALGWRSLVATLALCLPQHEFPITSLTFSRFVALLQFWASVHLLFLFCCIWQACLQPPRLWAWEVHLTPFWISICVAWRCLDHWLTRPGTKAQHNHLYLFSAPSCPCSNEQNFPHSFWNVLNHGFLYHRCQGSKLHLLHSLYNSPHSLLWGKGKFENLKKDSGNLKLKNRNCWKNSAGEEQQLMVQVRAPLLEAKKVRNEGEVSLGSIKG